MKRNQNIEAMRGGAILFILIYHYAIRIPGMIYSNFGRAINEGLCQSAMLLFFSISGFGIYTYLDSKRDNISVSHFIKRRFMALIPQYYFNIIIVLLTTGTAYIASYHCKTIVSMFLLVHNIFPSTNGHINGVTWTLGLMMQFYIIAIPLYKVITKYNWVVYVISILFTLIARALIFRYLDYTGKDPTLYVIYSIRQIYTTLDIFVGGMCAAHFYKKGYNKIPESFSFILVVGMGLLILTTFVVLVYTPSELFVWGNNIRSLIWPPLMGTEVALLLFCCTNMKLGYSSILGRVIQLIARNEYGIYLWHMVIIDNISANSPLYTQILNKSPIILLVIMMIIAILVGGASNRLFLKNNR